ncbi:hypothetical protein HDU96_003343, partial [Phlyctochytrium bullatum]
TEDDGRGEPGETEDDGRGEPGEDDSSDKERKDGDEEVKRDEDNNRERALPDFVCCRCGKAATGPPISPNYIDIYITGNYRIPRDPTPALETAVDAIAPKESEWGHNVFSKADIRNAILLIFITPSTLLKVWDKTPFQTPFSCFFDGDGDVCLTPLEIVSIASVRGTQQLTECFICAKKENAFKTGRNEVLHLYGLPPRRISDETGFFERFQSVDLGAVQEWEVPLIEHAFDNLGSEAVTPCHAKLEKAYQDYELDIGRGSVSDYGSLQIQRVSYFHEDPKPAHDDKVEDMLIQPNYDADNNTFVFATEKAQKAYDEVTRTQSNPARTNAEAIQNAKSETIWQVLTGYVWDSKQSHIPSAIKRFRNLVRTQPFLRHLLSYADFRTLVEDGTRTLTLFQALHEQGNLGKSGLKELTPKRRKKDEEGLTWDGLKGLLRALEEVTSEKINGRLRFYEFATPSLLIPQLREWASKKAGDLAASSETRKRRQKESSPDYSRDSGFLRHPTDTELKDLKEASLLLVHGNPEKMKEECELAYRKLRDLHLSPFLIDFLKHLSRAWPAQGQTLILLGSKDVASTDPNRPAISTENSDPRDVFQKPRVRKPQPVEVTEENEETEEIGVVEVIDLTEEPKPVEKTKP